MPWLMACIASIGGLLFGYNTGVISAVLPQLNVAWKLTALQEELAVSAVLFGAVVGAALVGIVADHIGRRDCIMATAALFVLGSFSGAMINSPEAFIACRALVGVALGAVSLVAPLYIAEIAPARMRGRLVTVNQLGITCGIMLSYAVPYFLQGIPDSWRYMLIIGTVPGVFLSMASLWLVESPRWLLSKGDEEEARANFKKIGDPDADEIIRDLKESLSRQSEDTWMRLAAPPIRLALFFVVGLFFFQQFVGINAFLYNASTILTYEGFAVADTNLAVTIGLSLVNLVMTLVAMALVDRISRRLLLRIGLVGMGACLSVLAAGSGFLDHDAFVSSRLAVVCLTGYIAFFSFSWGPLLWVIVAEVFPQRIRGAAMSIPVAAHWLFAIINASGAIFFLRELEDTGFYLIFAIVAFAGLLFLRKNFMETGGLALERIQRLFTERARALKKGNLVYYAITTVAGTGALLIGFNVGIIAGALVLITREWGLGNLEQGVLVSSLSAGLFIGQILAGKASDLFGRRYLLMSTAALFVAGAFASALAQSFPTLVGARFLIGLTMGVAAVANSVYISEIAPPEIRGRLLTLSQATLAVGILLSYLAALFFETLPHGWRYMFAAAAAPSAVYGLGLLFLPESPRWLYSRGRRSASLRMLRGMGVSDPEAAIEAMRQGQDDQEEGGWSELLNPKLFPPLLLGMILMFLAVFTGFDALLLYAPTIFQSAGFGSYTASVLATFGLGAVNLAMTLVSMWLVERLGRKPLVMWGLAIMICSLVSTGVVLGHTGWSGFWSRALLLGGLGVFVGAFAVSLGPVSNVVVSEIYPQRVRGAALGLVFGANSIFSFIFALIFPIFFSSLGSVLTFWIFGAITAAGALICWKYLPETKGCTLEEIESSWSGKKNIVIDGEEGPPQS
ncbi:MAG: sugar porter family MFS transporter [Desulfarculaceae bacterium]|nr:sugar porter family MFS transporter [Desulfarculaceae bacterium]MCF8073195.1 sugar porter family MFS transporter [Desulfarculaceae bacterium]MCF8100791.1 sugar porter family MFS transporter [Desulfarculaceae bacterium]MCF8118438.1 sugar porter family MFS transporter [Desulfarculaceae bacterium]